MGARRRGEHPKAAGGNLIYGSAPEQHNDQVKAGTATKPVFPCPNHATCGGTAAFEGVRCEPCRTEAGIQAAALLNEGVPLAAVTRRLGYTSERQMYAVACQYGGYKGTIAEAPRTGPPLTAVAAQRRDGLVPAGRAAGDGPATATGNRRPMCTLNRALPTQVIAARPPERHAL